MPTPIPQRLTLPNGLRVVLYPISGVPAAGVSVHYDVGFRSEPEGRTGFAHLFEHLMFQGSESVDRLEHFKYVQASGGSANGSTHQDYTDYYQVVPSAALERVLFLEADRMRAPRLTEENLRTQVEVVKEEIRLNVMNKPYGGFPWTVLPGLLYSTYPNAHNGYGDFSELEQATVDECAAFFDTYYAPGNAVLTVAGDIDPERTAELVWRHFEDIPARTVPKPVALHEPPPDQELRGTHHDPHAPMPATALGYRMPDPHTDLDGYLAHMVLTSILTGSDSARLKQRLIHREALVTDISTGCGLFGPMDARDPETFLCVTTHQEHQTQAFLDAFDEELAALAQDGPGQDELLQATALSTSGTHRKHDSLVSRVRAVGTQEVLFGRAELVDELPARLSGVTAEAIAAAARGLHGSARAVLSLRPTPPDPAPRAAGADAGAATAAGSPLPAGAPGRTAPAQAGGTDRTPSGD
ncbi:insulinase family protein [Streptomyces sp. AJS327]|uniref:M16 family metallopeptidase n=1 Tax=Streptomyces sp. AJS327 TaxID=2545265 RepID=UPI0015DF03CC|nr:pitrilysin family protein [Streptomyces sp. AJS327]MBA0053548.1 insulinase family protein [Streptomyces sp. AJS327]